MRTAVLALWVLCLAAADDDLDAQVVTLTTENFDEHTSSGDWMLEFYAPWLRCEMTCNAMISWMWLRR